MKTYIDQLKADTAEADNLRSEEAKDNRQHADTRVLCDKPLTDQIESLMRSLPPVQRERPWPMVDLVARLQGRYSARPHSMHVRALGWTQRRDWTRFGGGRRVWLGPNAD
jgi:hypothetical protein